MHSRVCPECGAAFVPRRSNQVCCSEECSKSRFARQIRANNARIAMKRRESRNVAAAERAKKAARRAEFFAARDAAFEKAGLPVPRIEERGGVRVERRGTCAGGTAFNPTVPISTKSYYYR